MRRSVEILRGQYFENVIQRNVINKYGCDQRFFGFAHLRAIVFDQMLPRIANYWRRDEVEAAWYWIDSIIAGWEETNHKVESYVAGSWGPAGATSMLDRDRRTWQPEG